VASVVELLQQADFCLLNFTGGDPVDVTLTAPDGQVRRLGAARQGPPGVQFLTWTVMLNEPLGTYQVNASQASLRASKPRSTDSSGSPVMLTPHAGRSARSTDFLA
jgi:hypothetical protein